MNQLYLYLYADVPAQEPSSEDARPVVIGDFDTRETAKREDDADVHPLSFI